MLQEKSFTYFHSKQKLAYMQKKKQSQRLSVQAAPIKNFEVFNKTRKGYLLRKDV